MNMKIVQFNDGTYGIRKWSFIDGYVYLDLIDGYWWPGDIPKYSKYYKTTDKRRILDRWEKITSKKTADIGIPIDPTSLR